jgi:hypothetical protein
MGFLARQCVGLVDETKTAAEIFREILHQAVTTSLLKGSIEPERLLKIASSAMLRAAACAKADHPFLFRHIVFKLSSQPGIRSAEQKQPRIPAGLFL